MNAGSWGSIRESTSFCLDNDFHSSPDNLSQGDNTLAYQFESEYVVEQSEDMNTGLGQRELGNENASRIKTALFIMVSIKIII